MADVEGAIAPGAGSELSSRPATPSLQFVWMHLMQMEWRLTSNGSGTGISTTSSNSNNSSALDHLRVASVSTSPRIATFGSVRLITLVGNEETFQISAVWGGTLSC